MDIKLPGGYRIYQADEMNIVLVKTTVIKSKRSKRNGETAEKRIGYFGKLEHALNEYKKRCMTEDIVDLSGVLLTLQTRFEQRATEVIGDACVGSVRRVTDGMY